MIAPPCTNVNIVRMVNGEHELEIYLLRKNMVLKCMYLRGAFNE